MTNQETTVTDTASNKSQGKSKELEEHKTTLDWPEEDPDVVETALDLCYMGMSTKICGDPIGLDLCILCYKFAETRFCIGDRRLTIV